MTETPIVSALFLDDQAGANPPPPGLPVPQTTSQMPAGEEISRLGADSRGTYAAVTTTVLEQHKGSDLGEMSGKITESVTVAKGLDPKQSRHGLVEKAFGFLHDEREQVLTRMQTEQRLLARFTS